MNRNTGMTRLVIGFGLVFAMFHPVERHIGAYFNESGDPSMGLLALVVGYFFLFVGDFLSPFLIGKWGPRKSMMIATCAYTSWVVAVAFKATLPIMITSILIGLSAALLWNSMASYVLRVNGTDYEQMGKDFASILSFYGLAAGGGLIAVSWLIAKFGFQTAFLTLTPFALIGVIFLSGMKKIEISRTSVENLLKTYTNTTILRLATIPMTAFILFGLLVGVIPLHIQRVMGTTSIGVLESGAFFVLLLCYFFKGWATKRNLLIGCAYPVMGAGLALLLVSPENRLGVILGTILICVAFALLFLVMFTLSDCALPHKIESALAVFTSADDITAFTMLLSSLILEKNGLSLNLLYWPSLALLLFSSFLVLPLMKGGSDLEEAKLRLARDFPTPA